MSNPNTSAILKLLAAARALVAAYGDPEAEDDGSSVEWEDLDAACELAREGLKLIDEAPTANGFDEDAIRQVAREKYAYPSNNDLEIDEGAALSFADDGVWVQAWVWLSAEIAPGFDPEDGADREDFCECTGTVHPGVSGVLLMLTASEEEENVERCDLCELYASDEAAAAALRSLGWVIEEEEAEDDKEGEPHVYPVSYLIVKAMPLTAGAALQNAGPR